MDVESAVYFLHMQITGNFKICAEQSGAVIAQCSNPNKQ